MGGLTVPPTNPVWRTAAILNFGNVNNSGLDIDLCTKVGGKIGGQMCHDYAEMTHDQKSKPVANSRDGNISASILGPRRALNLF